MLDFLCLWRRGWKIITYRFCFSLKWKPSAVKGFLKGCVEKLFFFMDNWINSTFQRCTDSTIVTNQTLSALVQNVCLSFMIKLQSILKNTSILLLKTANPVNGTEIQFLVKNIENRIYREELKESLGMNFFSPFQP